MCAIQIRESPKVHSNLCRVDIPVPQESIVPPNHHWLLGILTPPTGAVGWLISPARVNIKFIYIIS